MKITILLSFILMNTLVFSQDYKTAIGLKGGYPGFGSLNAKHFISEVKKEDKSWLIKCDLIVNHEKIKKRLITFFGNVIVLPEINPKNIKLAIKK